MDSIKHGRDHEMSVLQQLEAQENRSIRPCGLFIHPEIIPFLGASPDGVCGDETIMEIKCLITSHKIDIDQAIEHTKVNFWVTGKNGQLIVKNP